MKEVEETFVSALRSARIIDLQDGTTLKLPDTDQVVALGLTVDDRLSFGIDGESGDDLVLTLCHMERMEDGHWFIPSHFLPCFLNEMKVQEKSLLSQGSTFRVGDREIRYSLPLESRLRLTTKQSILLNGPPPKPRRTSVSGDVQQSNKQPMSAIMEETIAPVTSDAELIQHLNSPEEVAQVACSYVSHQVVMYTDLLMSTEELDFLFKAILSCNDTCADTMKDFVRRYNEEQEVKQDENGELWPLHGPVIFLLTELLKATMDSVSYATLWIKLLATFSNFSPNLPALIQHQVAPVVLGTMAVHSMAASLQQYACTVLAQLSTYTPPIGQKGPVREGGVDLVAFGLKNHVTNTLVLRPALRMLAHLTQTYSNLAADALSIVYFSDSQAENTYTIVLQEVERSMAILDFIEENALPVVMETMERHLRDLAIQTEGRRLLAFFVDEEVKERKKSLEMLTERKVRFQLDPNDPSTIVPTSYESLESSSDEDEESGRKVSNSSLATVILSKKVMEAPMEVEEMAEPMVDTELPKPKRKYKKSVAWSPSLDLEESDTEDLLESITAGLPRDEDEDVTKGTAMYGSSIGSIGSPSKPNIIADRKLDTPYRPERLQPRHSLTEFDPWDSKQPQSGPKLQTATPPEVEEESAGSEKEDMVFLGVADRVGSSSPQPKSLLDEISEVQPQVAKGINHADVNDCEDHNVTEPVITSTTPLESGLDDVESKENQEVLDSLYDDTKPVRLDKSSLGLDKSKGRSLKRGVQRMIATGRAMDQAIRSGRSKVLSGMKRGLRFKELLNKEGKFVESPEGRRASVILAESTAMHAGGDPEGEAEEIIDSDGSSRISGSLDLGRGAPLGAIAGISEIETRFRRGSERNAPSSGRKCSSEGVSDVSSVPVSTQSLDGSLTQINTDTNSSSSVRNSTGAPPLFLPKTNPKVKGQQNTVGNLIEMWKGKENTQDKTKPFDAVARKPVRRKHWRPFDQNSKETDSSTTDHDDLSERLAEPCGHNATLVIDSIDGVNANQDRRYSNTENEYPKRLKDLSNHKAYATDSKGRRKLGSVALLPDVEQFLIASRPSVTDSAEIATWQSSYHGFNGQDVQDMGPEGEQEVRVNRTKWKAVVAEIKLRRSSPSLPFQSAAREAPPVYNATYNLPHTQAYDTSRRRSSNHIVYLQPSQADFLRQLSLTEEVEETPETETKAEIQVTKTNEGRREHFNGSVKPASTGFASPGESLLQHTDKGFEKTPTTILSPGKTDLKKVSVDGRSSAPVHRTDRRETDKQLVTREEQEATVAVKALIIHYIIGQWEQGRSDPEVILDFPVSFVLDQTELSASLFGSVRRYMRVDRPIRQCLPTFATAMQDILRSRPTADLRRLQLLEEFSHCIRPTVSSNCQQVAAMGAGALLTSQLPRLGDSSEGAELLKNLQETLRRCMLKIADQDRDLRWALCSLEDRILIGLRAEIWL